MNQEDLEYERKYSHSHCWQQGKNPACGQPLENHKQCCLCDTVYKPRKRFPSQPNSEEKCGDACFKDGKRACDPGCDCVCHSPKPEENRCDKCNNPNCKKTCDFYTYPNNSKLWEKTVEIPPILDITKEKCEAELIIGKGEYIYCQLPKGHRGLIHNPQPSKDTSNEWKEDLYFEVTEDLIYLCKMFHLARDKKQQTENIRNQQRKLEDFISSLLSTAIKTREEGIALELEKTYNKCTTDRLAGAEALVEFYQKNFIWNEILHKYEPK